jgi:hypothetical protein
VIGYRWSTAARMRSLVVSFAAEQLGLEPDALASLMERP